MTLDEGTMDSGPISDPARSPMRLEERPDGVVVVVIDVPGEPVNTLREGFAEELGRAFDAIDENRDVKAVVIASGKPTSFIAGADIKLLQRIEVAEEAVALSQAGQQALERVERCKVPVVAAIAGPCLGGGLELALACHGRVAAQDPETRLGVPEVQLGVLPGLGGTQRLPRLVGVRTALDLLLTGRQIDAQRAQDVGLVDRLCPRAIVVEVAAQHALGLAERVARRRSTLDALRGFLQADELEELALADNPLGRKLLFDQARKRLWHKTRGNYPAPQKILDVVRLGLERGIRPGLEAEAQAFGELAVSPVAKRLMEVFFAQQSLKKERGVDEDVQPRPVRKVGIWGAGLMGSGIATVSILQAGVFVRLKDRTDERLAQALRNIRETVAERRRRRMSHHELEVVLGRVTATTTSTGFASCDLIIEAAFEDLGLKRELVAEVEALGGDEVIFATNTSSLPISAIAEGARHPERVVGMHYFSPVPKMPLLEVVVTEATAPWVTATCVELGKRQGKVVIVVRDGPGFYTSRILGAYLNEATYALTEGVPIEAIDEALVAVGFPVGPLQLLDEVGIDVGAKVGAVLYDAFGPRMAPPPGVELLVAEDRLGRKSDKGFYRYDGESKKGQRPADPRVYELLGVEPRASAADVAVAERCVLRMVNEAARCVGEGIVRSPRDADVGAIFGLGFPPYLGGPCRSIDAQGAETVVRRLEELRTQYGERFTPAPRLLELAERGERFYEA